MWSVGGIPLVGWHLKSEMHAGPWAGKLASRAYLHWMELRVGGRQKNQSLRGGRTAPWRYSLPFSIFCELSKEEKFVVDTFYNKGYNNSVNVSDLPVKGRLFSNFCWS